VTEPPDLRLDKSRSATALTPPARHMHLTVLETFAETGRAPLRADLDLIARGQGEDPGAVVAELAARDVIAFDGNGEIRAAYPFSPAPTPIQVTWEDGPQTYAMCAIDALGMSAMLGRPVTITAREPASGRIVSVEVRGDRARWRPRRAVVFSGATGDASCPSVDRTCRYINFFTSARAARDWVAGHPDISGTMLGQAQALRHGIAEFGALMRAGARGAGGAGGSKRRRRSRSVPGT
jgi:Alkylmercury lyase